jgi:hypothetical protein
LYQRNNSWRRQQPPPENLLLTERHTVGALVHGGIGFVGTHHNAIQGTIVLGITMVCAGLDGAFDALVGMAVHSISSFFMWYKDSMVNFEFYIHAVAFPVKI